MDERSVFGPGTGLLGGFTVAEGSWLFGVAFPRHVAFTDRPDSYGWEAVLALTGKGEEVVKAYLLQATHLGFPEERQEHRCEAKDGSEICEGAAVHQEDGREILFQVQTISDSRRQGSDWPRAFVRLDLDGLDAPPAPSPSDSGSNKSSPKHALGDLPSRGERFGGAYTQADPSNRLWFRIVSGSSLIAPPYIDHHAVPGPFQYAVLKITGETASVLSRYEEQAHAYFPRTTGDEQLNAHWYTVTQKRAICPGGCGDHETRAIELSGAKFLLLKSTPRS